MRERVVVIGAGGHARSILDILLENAEYEIVGCLDPAYEERNTVEYMEEISIIGTDDLLEEIYNQGVTKCFVALGSNKLRQKLFQKAEKIGYSFVNAVSQYARVSKRTQLGRSVCIMAGAVINVNCKIGDGCIINTNCSLDHDCDIGAFAHIAPGVAVSGGTRIGEGTHIGTNTAVIDGICIGDWSYIGAGAAVVKNIEAHTMAYGVPAVPIRTI